MNINASWRPEYAVRWHEGMFLLPAHYQLTDRHNEFLLAKRFAAASPFAWGVVRRQLDVSQLGSGILRVLELEAVMPDGLYVRYSMPIVDESAHPRQTEPVLELKLDDLQNLPNTVQTIWLVVPHASPDPTDEYENLRYRHVEFSVHDPATEEAQPVPLLAPNLSLFLGDPPARFTVLPIAKISFRDGNFQLAPYEPPQLVIRRDSPIYRLLLDLVTTARNRAASLIRQDEHLADHEFHSRFEPHLILPGLLGPLPMFETLLFSESVAPLHLFAALSNMIGALSCVGHTTLPRRIDYDHLDPLRCFTELVDAIRLEMELRIPTRHREIPFTQENERFFLSPRRLTGDGPLLIGVALRPGSDENKVIRWFEEAIIGFENEIESLRLRRSVGAHRETTSLKGILTLSRRMLFWDVSVAVTRLIDEPFYVVAGSESEKTIRPDAIYLLRNIKEADGS